MKISAVYIAKNEAKTIARSLDSIKDAADELILVDTGSTDDTVEIFKSYGGKVFFRKWDDDFSAPRNLALSKATGDWIIILDADESFSKETRKNIKGVLESCSSNAKGLLINIVNYDKDSGEALDEFYALRIVRNIQGLNYKGRIHEMLHIGDDNFFDAQRVSKELLSINHTGYSSSISMEKTQRNLRMIKAAIAAGDPAERYYTNLYETYGALGDIEKSLYYAKLDVARGRQDITYASRSYRGLLAHYSKDSSLAGKLERLKYSQLGVKAFPELPDFHAEYSEALYQLSCYEKAKEEIELALSLLKDYDGMEPCLLTAEMIPVMEKRQKEIERLAEKNPDIKISACVIVKNEENNILSWLENVGVFADEIIINDTGSEDGTKELITRFSEENPDMPMVLLESTWQDDFSIAKNQCLSEATGDWIVFTDADELFVNPEFVKGYIHYVRQDSKLQALFVPMSNVDTEKNNSVINYFNALRIFCNLSGIHYEGRIHESLTLDGTGVDELNTQLADKCLMINHIGYSSNISSRKARRNIELLKRDIQEGQDIRKLYRYLAECYYMLKDYQRALDNALLATQSPYQPIGQQGDMYWLALNAMEKLNYGLEDKLVIADTGIKLFSKLPDFHARKGMLLTENGNYQKAIGFFEKSLELLEIYNQTVAPVNSSNIMSVLHEVYADLGICLCKIVEPEAAETMFKTALSINPWTEKAICGWADIYNGQLDNNLLEGIEKLYQQVPDYKKLLAGIFAANGLVELAECYGAEKNMDLIRAKSYSCIYNSAMKEIAEILPYLYVCLLEKYDEEYVAMLPEGLGNIVKYFHGVLNKDTIRGYYDDYKAFINNVIMMCSPETVSRYIDMCSVVSDSEGEQEKHIIEVAEALLKCDWVEQALDLYNQISAESEYIDSGFWQNVGICFFRQGHYQQALECFQRAGRSPKTDTYIAWCQEVMDRGN